VTPVERGLPVLTETDDVFRDELSQDERTLWSGRPRQGLLLRASDAFLIPFSLMWGGFAIFWEYAAVTNTSAPHFLVIWGIPFVAIGLYLIFGRFFVDAARRARTFYVLTDERVIIISGIFSRTIKSLPLKTLTEVNLVTKSNNSGTITFGHMSLHAYMAGVMPWPGMSRYLPPSFEFIEDARAVYDQIREAQKAV
jgi:hypothetical protein